MFRVFLVGILGLIAIRVASGAAVRNNIAACPDVQAIYPCTCVSGESLYCQNLTNLNELVSAFRGSSGSGIKNFFLAKSELAYIPIEIFNFQPIQHMEIEDSVFVVLFDRPENVTNYVYSLSITNVGVIHNWNWNQFRTFHVLNRLFISNVNIDNSITEEFSREVSEILQILHVVNSGITNIDQSAFKRQRYLLNIVLSENQLTTLERNTLPVPSSLMYLFLDGNRITSLPDDIFTDMPNLEGISLANNTLSTISEPVFTPVWNSQKAIALNDNPLKCDCHIKWAIESNSKPGLIGTCASPKKLYGRNLDILTVDDLNCRE